ncbi:MAG: hypothetical protein TREMPRED_001564 [Tremellales sp. Tagirdzhanova-0007]|nr:MAG: hypothetical protein TREMPRED_001564 [Tremellales sp. Tagirdzhanova-0007]
MSVAVIQGASGGLGLALTRRVLAHTSLKVYALTHRQSLTDLTDQLGGESERLTVLDGVDVQNEASLESAAGVVKSREGKGSVRLVACLAGVLHPEKSLSALDPSTALSSFAINSLGHLVTYKHFVPLIPTKKDFQKLRETWTESGDPAKGIVGSENSLCWSLSARVGSITDNVKGGWYSYRASKAALNQIIRTLDHELVNRSSSALAVAYHPGTVLTSFTAPIIGRDASPDPQKGVFPIDDAIEHMTHGAQQGATTAASAITTAASVAPTVASTVAGAAETAGGAAAGVAGAAGGAAGGLSGDIQDEVWAQLKKMMLSWIQAHPWFIPELPGYAGCQPSHVARGCGKVDMVNENDWKWWGQRINSAELKVKSVGREGSVN